MEPIGNQMNFNFAYEYYLNQIQEVSSEVQKHLLRIELNKLSGSELNFSDYVLNIQEQNTFNYKYPKLNPELNLIDTTGIKQSQALIIKTILDEGYVFTGIITLESNSIFYEFVNTFNLPYEYFKQYRFLYVEVNQINKASLSSKLPKVVYWDVTTNSNNIQPDKIALVNSRANLWTDYKLVEMLDGTHPFLPGFFFSNRIVIQNQDILYEYFDSQGLYGVKDDLYISNLQPLNLDFPLGHPGTGGLKYDECKEYLIDQFPSSGTEYQLGTFTGYVTTSLYHPSLIYYLYKREETAFLSLVIPDPNGRQYANNSLELNNLKKSSLVIISDDGAQHFNLSQSTLTPYQSINLS